jgi:Tfp pilus assembly protein PilN
MATRQRPKLEFPSRRAPEVPINLLPREVMGEQQTRRYFGYAAVGAVAIVALLVALSVLQHSRISSQQKLLENSQAQVTTLQTQVTRLAPFDQLNQVVQLKRQTLATALVGDVNWTRFLDDLDHRIPSGTSLSTLSLTGAAGTTPDGLPSYGTISFAGTVGSFPGLAVWLEAMNASTGMHFVYLGSGSKTPGQGVSFSATANITGSLLSGRCQTEASPCP